jgi:hypothetical protein
MSTFELSQLEQTTGKEGTAPTGDLLGELVGEGKKFKTVEDLAKGKLAADSHIGRLEVENKALREAMESEGTPEQVLAKINDYLSKKGSENAEVGKGNQPQAQPLTQEKVLELLQQREKETKVQNNVESFKANVKKALGDKAHETIKARLDELSMDAGLFETMVERNPQAALKLLGLKEQGPAGPMESSVRTEAFFGESGKGERRNFAYFQNKRRELGMRYYEPEIQREVFEARKEQGEAFWK